MKYLMALLPIAPLAIMFIANRLSVATAVHNIKKHKAK